MSVGKSIVLYVICLLVFLVIDFIWLTVISKGFYKEQLGHLMADKVNFLPAIIFYLLFVVGAVVLAVLPGIEAKSLSKTLLLSALLGCVSYATYDLSNFATLKDWPAKVVLVDIAWGTFLSSVVGLAGYYAGRFLV